MVHTPSFGSGTLLPKVIVLLQGLQDSEKFSFMLKVNIVTIAVRHSIMDGVLLGASKIMTAFMNGTRHHVFPDIGSHLCASIL